jgi:hypothetical protein
MLAGSTQQLPIGGKREESGNICTPHYLAGADVTNRFPNILSRRGERITFLGNIGWLISDN